MIWDYVDDSGRNLVRIWAQRERLATSDRARLNQQLDLLETMPFELAIKTGFLSKVGKAVFKLSAGEDIQLRLLLAKASPAPEYIPLAGAQTERQLLGDLILPAPEYTLLAGASEVHGTLVPSTALQQAESRLERVAADPNGRRTRHERF